MIDGTCNGEVALILVSDLDERAESVSVEVGNRVNSGEAIGRRKQDVS
jgi:hypothetical protein